MTGLHPPTPRASPFGTLLQHWRKVRRVSQLALATEAEVSPRHVCFVETGRARPSREMVLLLASTLDVPLRERNALLLAAGYAPTYRETDLAAPELAPARAALAAILGRQEPFPAVVMNRAWDILEGNEGASRFFGFLLERETTGEPANVIRMMFDPAALRPFVVEWETVAETLLQRVQREAVGGIPDERTKHLLDEVFAFPGVPRRWRQPSPETPLVPVIPVTFRKDGQTFSFFSAITTLGTAQDITLQELRIESFFPLDAETERHVQGLPALARPEGGSG